MQRHLIVVLVVATALAGCGSDDEPPRAAPAEAMAEYAARFADAESFTFQIGLDGPPVVVEEAFTLEGIEGVYRSPDQAEADVLVDVLGLTGILTILALGEDVWRKGPLTTEWEPVVSDELLTVRDLFAPDGLEALLAEDLTSLVWEADTSLEEFPGETLAVLSGETAGERLGRLTLGVLDGEATDVRLYIAGDEVRRIELTEQGTTPPRSWTIDVFAYDRPVDISPAP